MRHSPLPHSADRTHEKEAPFWMLRRGAWMRQLRYLLCPSKCMRPSGLEITSHALEWHRVARIG